MTTLFIQITPLTTNYTIASNLTKMQYRLWLFLYHLDPFGDRPVLIPTPAELARRLNMSVRSVYRALRKLNQLGLFTIASSYTRSIINGVKNKPLGTKKYRQRDFNQKGNGQQRTGYRENTQDSNSQPAETTSSSQQFPDEPNSSCAKNVTTSHNDSKKKEGFNDQSCLTTTNNMNSSLPSFLSEGSPEMSSTLPKQSQPCQNWQTQSPQANDNNGFTAPQTNSDPIKTLSDIEGSENINSIFNSQQPEVGDPWLEDDIYNSTSAEDKNLGAGSSAAGLEHLNENNSSITADNRDDRTSTSSQVKPSRENNSEVVTAEILPESNTTTAIVNRDRSVIVPKQNLFNWLPPGPWSIDGKLDPSFRDWLASEWIKEYGGTIHQKRANVLAYFQNKPAMLPVQWERYRNEYCDRARNAQTRLRSGMAIADNEQQQLLNHHGAILKPLPPEMSPVADKKSPPTVEGDKDPIENKAIKTRPIAVSFNNNLSSHHHSNLYSNTLSSPIPSSIDRTKEIDRTSTIDFNNLPEKEEKPDNPQAYQLYRPEETIQPADPQVLKQMFSNLRNALGLKTKATEDNGGHRRCAEGERQLNKLNHWLADPLLYDEAVKRAKSLGYQIEYNSQGVAVSIVEPEFAHCLD